MNTPYIRATHAADAARWTRSAPLALVLMATFSPIQHTPRVAHRPFPIQEFLDCKTKQKLVPGSDKTLDDARFERYECMKGCGRLRCIDVQALLEDTDTSTSTIYKQLDLLIRDGFVKKAKLPGNRTVFEWVAA